MKIGIFTSYFRDSLVDSIVHDLLAQAADLRAVDLEVHLWALDSPHPAVAPMTRGVGRLGKWQAFNRLLPYARDIDLIIFVDDDVALSRGFLLRYATIVGELGASLAQAAVTADSHRTFIPTVENTRCWARLTNFIEAGPVFSMTRQFASIVVPFADSNPMGWGNDVYWSHLAVQRQMTMAVIDACPIRHAYRPIGALYSTDQAREDMQQFLRARGVSMPSKYVVFRTIPRLCQREIDYVDGVSLPEALETGLNDEARYEATLFWAIVDQVRPHLVVKIGRSRPVTNRVLTYAAIDWGVLVFRPVGESGGVFDMPSESLHEIKTEVFREVGSPAPTTLLDIDYQEHSYDGALRLLDTWVDTWLSSDGVALLQLTDPLEKAVNDWLRNRPRFWHWRPLSGASRVGLLWRLADRPDLERLLDSR